MVDWNIRGKRTKKACLDDIDTFFIFLNNLRIILDNLQNKLQVILP